MLLHSRDCHIVILLLTAVFSLPMSGAEKILVHGHRGARARRPENTIPAFRYAIQTGADALELDMAVTKDNIIVVSHDPILRLPVCSGPAPSAVIHTLTLNQVREWDCGRVQNPGFPTQEAIPGTRMPTLDQVFDLAKDGAFDFNIETKSFPEHPEYTPLPPALAQMVLAKIREHQLEKRIILQSFDFRTLVAMKTLAPEIRLSALTEKDTRPFPVIAAEAKADIISPHFHLVTPEKVAEAHAAHLQVVPWTADTPEQWDKLIDAKVDAIISDDPAALIEYLRARGLH
jgi:glycerophosphoryl diester phosphodiesterase